MVTDQSNAQILETLVWDAQNASTGLTEQRSSAKELMYSHNRCLMNIGLGIVNIGDYHD